jgi:phosphoketolase
VWLSAKLAAQGGILIQEKAIEGGRVHVFDGEEIRRLDAYWRAANYLSVGEIYLMDNLCSGSR